VVLLIPARQSLGRPGEDLARDVLGDKIYSSRAIGGHLRDRRITAVIAQPQDRSGTASDADAPAAVHRVGPFSEGRRSPRAGLMHPSPSTDSLAASGKTESAVTIWFRE